jgi:predicted metal-binding membrane protein
MTGYILAWIGFALIATTAQWALDRALLLTPMMEITGSLLGGLVLIAIGIYQWSPLKDVCLRECQAPLAFIQRHGGFRQAPLGSLSLGLRHGLFCVGCCWPLMSLLFIGGVMNVLWITGLAFFVLVEKVVPAGRILSRIAGVGFAAMGIWVVIANFI